MMVKLKLQYFGHLMRRVDTLEKTLMMGGIGGSRRRGKWGRVITLIPKCYHLREARNSGTLATSCEELTHWKGL